MSEIWCRAFDKPHGVIGADTVNHESLAEAIRLSYQVSKWKEPNFLNIAEAYRREKNHQLAQIERVRNRTEIDQEERECTQEDKKRRREIDEWSTERLMVAMNLVGKRLPTFRGKSMDKSSWSFTYVGLIWAADRELNG